MSFTLHELSVKTIVTYVDMGTYEFKDLETG